MSESIDDVDEIIQETLRDDDHSLFQNETSDAVEIPVELEQAILYLGVKIILSKPICERSEKL